MDRPRSAERDTCCFLLILRGCQPSQGRAKARPRRRATREVCLSEGGEFKLDPQRWFGALARRVSPMVLRVEWACDRRWPGPELLAGCAFARPAWSMPVTPSVTHDGDGKAIPAVAGRAADGEAMLLRWAVIDTVGGLASGTGLSSLDSLAEYLNWRQPGTIEPQTRRSPRSGPKRTRSASWRKERSPPSARRCCSAIPRPCWPSPLACRPRRPALAGSART